MTERSETSEVVVVLLTAVFAGFALLVVFALITALVRVIV